MTPTMEEVAGWLREAANTFKTISAHLPGGIWVGLEGLNLDRAAQVEAMGWRPIEEAKLSIGYRCLLCNGITVVTGYWGGSRWVNERSGIGSTYPATHFMPIPQPPVKK